MTDPLDTEIRRLMGELWQQAPLPPTAEKLRHRRPSHARRVPPRRAWIAAPVAMISVLAVILVSLGNREPSTQVATQGAPTSSVAGAPDLGGDAGSRANEALPEPTFVSPSRPPAGLRFIEGGSARITSGASSEVLVAGIR